MPQPIHKVEHSLSQQVVVLYQNHQQLHAPQSHDTHLQLQSDNHCLQSSQRIQALCLVFIRGVIPTAEMVHLKQEERFLMAWVVMK